MQKTSFFLATKSAFLLQKFFPFFRKNSAPAAHFLFFFVHSVLFSLRQTATATKNANVGDFYSMYIYIQSAIESRYIKGKEKCWNENEASGRWDEDVEDVNGQLDGWTGKKTVSAAFRS